MTYISWSSDLANFHSVSFSANSGLLKFDMKMFVNIHVARLDMRVCKGFSVYGIYCIAI